MSCMRTCSILVLILSAVACGGSGKPADAPASAPSAESSAAASSDEAKPAPAEAKAKPQEEAAPESTEPECTKDKDCMIFADCCTCKAVPAAAKPPVPCEAVCGESKCEVKGKTMDNVACVSGRCKVK